MKKRFISLLVSLLVLTALVLPAGAASVDLADPEALLRAALPGLELEILEKRPVEYRCDCSRERMERALVSLGREELRAMIDEQGGAELTCQFCDEVYRFNAQELGALRDEASAK